MTRIIDSALLDSVSAEARVSPRLRKNRNFHADDADACHRLLNAVEPDSYIPPHRHLHPTKAETIVVLRGRLVVLYFDDAGQVSERVLLEPGTDQPGAALAVNIPVGCYHSILALTAGAVFFEAKAGPYVPLSDQEKAPWAPAENSPEATAYLAQLKARYG